MWASTSRTKICDLPIEILISIFSYLPVADLALCAATSQQWLGIVMGFTHLWKGKEYKSHRSPTDCAETRAVMHALPPFQEVTIKSANIFMVEISYPSIVIYITDGRVLKSWPRLSCKVLSIGVDIAEDILWFQSTIHFEGLQHLRILRARASSNYSANYVVYSALSLCPNLRHLSVRTDSISAEHLDMVQGLSQLQSLELWCADLSKLSFLRHCSGTLEELQLLDCASLPSRELAELEQLQNLRRLQLSDCVFQQRDMAAAVAGLANLETLRLDCCSLIPNLSILKSCGQLRELSITKSYVQEPLLVGREQLQLQDLRLPTDDDFRFVRVADVSLTAEDLSAALTRLEQLGLTRRCLAYLGALHHCSQLRRLCCEFVQKKEQLEPFNVRIRIILTRST